MGDAILLETICATSRIMHRLRVRRPSSHAAMKCIHHGGGAWMVEDAAVSGGDDVHRTGLQVPVLPGR